MADGMGADGFGTTQPRTQAYVEKSKAELEDLAKDGLTMAGNAFSPVLFLKAQAPGGDEGLLAGTDGSRRTGSRSRRSWTGEGPSPRRCSAVRSAHSTRRP